MQQRIDKLNQSVDSNLILLQNLENQDEVTSIFNQGSYEEVKYNQITASSPKIRKIRGHRKSKSKYTSYGLKSKKKEDKQED